MVSLRAVSGAPTRDSALTIAVKGGASDTALRLHRTDDLTSANVPDAISAIRLRAGRVFPAFAAILIPASVQDSQCPSEHQVRLPSELVSMCP